MIIGVVGPICAGKDLLADILVTRHGFIRLSLADALRAEVRKRGIEPSRTILQDVGDEIRKTEGPDGLTKRVLPLIEHDKNYVITGFRNPGELPPLQQLSYFTILLLESPTELRFERMRDRAREQDPTTLEAFKQIEQRDLGIGQPSHGQQNAALFSMATKTIHNNGTQEQLADKVTLLLTELKITV